MTEKQERLIDLYGFTQYDEKTALKLIEIEPQVIECKS